MAQQVGVRGSRNRMILILVHRNEIAEGIKIRLFAAVEFFLSVKQSIIACAASKCSSDMIDTRGSS